ncbi:MAG: hypothetical protein HYY78_03720 [Betaproteobacteria bacterium]|nr:hypothetical protein [Betaproteobacteria bacterium]
MLRILVAIGLIILFGSPTRADTRSHCGDGNVCDATLEGTISNSDVLAFREIAKKIASNQPSNPALIITLNSKGGDIKSAIEIGKIIRRLPKSAALVGRDDTCFSACVFVLAGAVLRSVSGKVGIHRPYTATNEQQNFQTRQQEFTVLSRTIRDFLESMNLPSSLYDEMMQIPPQATKVLSDAELGRFGLDRNDPVYQDLIDSDNARGYGLTKAEYLARKARAFSSCPSLNAPSSKNIEELRQAYERERKCLEEVMTGVRQN